mgnify:CR=1 FL=1
MNESPGPVSVIIPTWNRAPYLERAIHSVLRQTLPCQEILVIDDGSTDQTPGLIEELSAQSAVPLRYFFQENQGPAAARNLGVRHARFPLIAFLDSDDHWHKDKLSHQYTAMAAEPGYLISHTRERWLRRGVHLNQKKKHIPRHGDIFVHCLQLCAVGMSTVMVRRELFSRIGTFNEELRCCEDYDFWLRVSAKHPFLLIDTPLTVKEGGRSDQVSVQYQVGMDRFRIQALMALVNSGQLTPEQQLLARLELHRKSLIYGQGCLRHGRVEEGQQFLEYARRYQS